MKHVSPEKGVVKHPQADIQFLDVRQSPRSCGEAQIRGLPLNTPAEQN